MVAQGTGFRVSKIVGPQYRPKHYTPYCGNPQQLPLTFGKPLLDGADLAPRRAPQALGLAVV